MAKKIAVVGAHRNGQRLNDKLLGGHRDRNRVMYSILLPADDYVGADTFEGRIDAARAAQEVKT